MEETGNNKILWLIGGLVIGFFIAKYRTDKNVEKKVEVALQNQEKEIENLMDSVLQNAAAQGLSPEDVRQQIKGDNDLPQDVEL